MLKTLLQKLLVLSLIIFSFSCSKNNDDDDIYYQEVNISYSNMELEIMKLLNDYRAEIGLSKLNELNIVSEEALEHTNYMISTGDVSHYNFTERLEYLIKNASAKEAAENVAFGFITAQSVVDSWIKSDEHRKTIERGNFTHFGISAKTDANGRYYFTNIFIERK